MLYCKELSHFIWMLTVKRYESEKRQVSKTLDMLSKTLRKIWTKWSTTLTVPRPGHPPQGREVKFLGMLSMKLQ